MSGLGLVVFGGVGHDFALMLRDTSITEIQLLHIHRFRVKKTVGRGGPQENFTERQKKSRGHGRSMVQM